MEFKNKIYNFVKKIPQGRVATYKSVAVAIGLPKSSRAVANVLAQNFDPKIPCHRVVRSDGFVSGYNRGGPVQKSKLLQDEGVLIKDLRVNKEHFI